MEKTVMLSRMGNVVLAFNNAKKEVEDLAKDCDKESIHQLLANMSKNIDDNVFKLDITMDEIRHEES
jgi:hypothetical protein